jgi:prepilin-type N-terminal cleavage/methylation domain-containing protein
MMPSRAAITTCSRHLTRATAPRAGRAGFTLPEILIVIVMISVLALLAIPRFAVANGRRHMESARMRVAAAVATARQAGIQKGQTITFRIASNRVTVNTDAGDTLLSPVPLDTLYKVTTPDLTFQFSGRGFANLDSQKAIILTRPGVADDTVTVSRTGMVKQ